MRESFFGRETTLVTALLCEGSVAKYCETIRSAAMRGADGIALDLHLLPEAERTGEHYRKMMDAAPELPFMFLLYRNDAVHGGDDEARQKYLLDAARAGAEVIDVMGDLFDPEEYELAVRPEAIERQKALIDEIHGLGSKVIMSSHMKVPRRAEDVLRHLREQASRGADLLKIVTWADTEEDFLETLRTTFLLKRELDKPFVQLCNGKYSHPVRFLGAKLGLALTFAQMKESENSQPTVAQFRAVLDNIHWNF